MARKKFKETKVGKFLKNKAPHILEAVGDVLPNSGALGLVKGIIESDKELSEDDKQKSLKLLEMDIMEMNNVSKRWSSDMGSDSWLSKNVRPLTLVYLLAFMGVIIICDSLNIKFEVKEAYIKLLEALLITVVFAYFGSRGAEKFKKISNEKK